MDAKTIDAYDKKAAEFAKEWDEQPEPADMYALVRRYFKPGLTADIGCGAGRDTAWLHRNGFGVVGYDISKGLLAQARRLHPEIRFEKSSLPELECVSDDSFTNVLCETVIMHLDTEQITKAVQRLVSILAPGGILYLSWRVTEKEDKRDVEGRLYSSFDANLVAVGLGKAKVLFAELVQSQSSGKTIRQIIAQKARRRSTEGDN